MKTEEVNNLIKNIDYIKSLMIAYVTSSPDEQNHPNQYKIIYLEINKSLKRMGLVNPNPFESIQTFKGKAKNGKFPTYQQRKELVHELYLELEERLNKELQSPETIEKWEKAESMLIDEYSSIKTQWDKAKSFIFNSKSFCENSIKESINSIETLVKIKTKEENGTLGELIKKVDIHDSIKLLISKLYGVISNIEFVRHGGKGNHSSKIEKEEAMLYLEVCSDIIKYLLSK